MDFIDYILYTSIYIGLVATSFYILTYLADRKKTRFFFSDQELPFVSVIIPAYNEEKGLALTLDSILESDYPKSKLDILVVNDGSKDKTLEIAYNYKAKGIRIFSKNKNQGKGSALNLGIKKAKGEIIFTMDSDTIVDKRSLKSMTRYFKEKEVMAVTPAIVTIEPKNIIQRVQYMEYLTGLFLRKTFAALNAVHITPGAFSAYRKSFFENFGGYDVGNITEDLEMALRIQYNKFKIENDPNATVFTNPPEKFSHLLKQRRRWYIGLMRNIFSYRKLFTKEYGDLGVFVLPIAWISIFFSIFILIYYLLKSVIDFNKELLFYKSINFDFGNLFYFNFYVLERTLFKIMTSPVFLFLIFFMSIVGVYVFYASRRIGRVKGLYINLPLFFILFAPLFGFWWVVSIVYIIFTKDISWK